MLRTLSTCKFTHFAVQAAAIIAILISTACTPAPAQPTPIPTALPATQTSVPTAEPTEIPTAVPTEVPPTATATEAPTATATATAVPTLGPAAENGLSGWCLPEGVSTEYIGDPFQPYPNSRIGTIATDESFEIRNLPVSACNFIYQFNQPVPEGMTLAVYEQDGTEPWTTAPLKAIEGQPQAAMATLTHAYIIAFPFWQTSYRFAVLDAAGNEVRSDRVNLYRWQPELCWNGALPDLKTLRCPLQQDLHPWDAGYGTPFPTPKPEE